MLLITSLSVLQSLWEFLAWCFHCFIFPEVAKQLCSLEEIFSLVYLFGFVLYLLSSDLSVIMLFESDCL